MELLQNKNKYGQTGKKYVLKKTWPPFTHYFVRFFMENDVIYKNTNSQK